MANTAKVSTQTKPKSLPKASVKAGRRKQRSPAKKGEPKKLETIAPLRLTQEEKELIYQAAEVSNQSVSNFVINNILRISLKVIENQVVLVDDEELSTFEKKKKLAKPVLDKMKSAMKHAALFNEKR